MITGTSPILASSNISASLDYYTQKLGFENPWKWGHPITSFGGVSLGSVSIMFNLQRDLAKAVAGHQLFIKVEDADKSYADHQQRGAQIIEPIEDKAWNMREYLVEDPSGYHLRFAGPPKGSSKPSKAFPEGVELEFRVPTPAEYEATAGKAFYSKGCEPSFLEKSWGGVVAMTNGTPIGMVRIMHDAPGWFSIWDVAVVPEWQGQHIGHKMMEVAVEMIQKASPGANVYLFTYKQGFYDKLGFTNQSVSMRRV